MKNFNRFTFPIIVGVIVGIILAFFHINIQKNWILIISIIFIISLTYFLIQHLNPSKLLFKGKYNEAIKYFYKLSSMYTGNIKFQNIFLYNIALCYHRMGEFDLSNETLEKLNIKILDKNLKWCYFKLLATNLLLKEDNLDTAEMYLNSASDLLVLNESLPILAYFEILKGNKENSLEYLTKYINNKKTKKLVLSFSKATLIFDKFALEIQNNFFIGLSYLKMSNSIKAKEYLLRSSRCDYENYFSSKAKEILKTL